MRVGYTKTQSALEVSFSSNGLNSQTQNAALSLEGDKLNDACNTVIGFEIIIRSVLSQHLKAIIRNRAMRCSVIAFEWWLFLLELMNEPLHKSSQKHDSRENEAGENFARVEKFRRSRGGMVGNH